jgi:hypothetical protein
MCEWWRGRGARGAARGKGVGRFKDEEPACPQQTLSTTPLPEHGAAGEGCADDARHAHVGQQHWRGRGRGVRGGGGQGQGWVVGGWVGSGAGCAPRVQSRGTAVARHGWERGQGWVDGWGEGARPLRFWGGLTPHPHQPPPPCPTPLVPHMALTELLHQLVGLPLHVLGECDLKVGWGGGRGGQGRHSAGTHRLAPTPRSRACGSQHPPVAPRAALPGRLRAKGMAALHRHLKAGQLLGGCSGPSGVLEAWARPGRWPCCCWPCCGHGCANETTPANETIPATSLPPHPTTAGLHAGAAKTNWPQGTVMGWWPMADGRWPMAEGKKGNTHDKFKHLGGGFCGRYSLSAPPAPLR